MADAAEFQGTSASTARRWLRRTGTLLAGAPLLAGLLQLPSAAAAQSTTAARAPGSVATRSAGKAEPTGSRTVDVSLDTLTPSAPKDGDTLTLSGTVTNESKRAVSDAELALRVGQRPLNGRAAIDALSKRSGYIQGAEGSEIDGKYTKKFADLAPGIPRAFTISVPVDKLNLGSDGVYQLDLALMGQTTAQPWQQILGIKRTFLPWQPDAPATKTKTTYLWPLISTTHLTAETGSDEQQTPVFRDDSLAKEIGPGGRLEQLLSLGSGLDVTWVVDPDLLASVDAMTRPYEIQGPKGKNTPGKNQAVAKQWLNQLEKTVSDAEVVALPFADPDLASLAHSGKNVSGSLSHLKEATDVAAGTVETILHVKASTDFAWPVNGAIDPSIVDVATSAGAHKVITRSDSLVETGGLTYTPTSARPIGGGTTAVATDARLSTAFQGDMTRAETSTLAVQTFLAQSLMLARQTPEHQRSIVVAPQRMPTTSQAQTMAKALGALENGGWSASQQLSAAAKAKPDSRATTRIPSARSYPASLRKQQMPQDAFESMKKTQDKLNRFTAILSDSSRVVTPMGRAIDRQMSTSWRGRAREATVFRDGVASYLSGLAKGVRLIDKSETKLSGRSATIPVTVQNNLVQGVDHLTLRLTSTKPTRLKIGDAAYEEQPVKVTGGHSQSVKFTTTGNANGKVPVVAQLYTEDGEPYGQAVTFDVDVTEITATVMLVIAGGVLLLVLAGFRMYTQRKRAAAQQAAEGDETPANNAADEAAAENEAEPTADTEGTEDTEALADDAEGESGAAHGTADAGQPGDPAPDTASESTDPSGTGERVDR